ncbi:LUC7-related [Ostreococcus tauri]|uniref:LUC7-related n=1 Tax=Ostreococcus tauri TaxID=70448 RepID=A0A096PAX6_OSTTA|nr:LUC7-related [Ostreococcus tauri]CEG02156.1 LUC7-related [Ostreococcus tauri]|eukprot:XP_022841380.1 LUC7-related [Ostreococcus tauri]
MADAARAALDELMGAERDVPLDQRTGRGRHFTDADVCKYYLCGFDVTCFKNTKSDGDILRVVGASASEKIRDDGLREDFERATSAERARTGYERMTLSVLDDLIRECDRRIARGRARAKQEREEAERKAATSAEADTLRLLEQKMTETAERAEKLGEDGDVDGAEREAALLETLQTRHDEVKRRYETLDGWRLTEPCEVSGTLLCSTDTEERRRDHLVGKQYKGWSRIRELRDEIAARLVKYEADGLVIGDASDAARRHRDRGDRRSRSPDRGDRRDRGGGRRRSGSRERGDRRYEPYRRQDDRHRESNRRYDRYDDRRRDDRRDDRRDRYR